MMEKEIYHWPILHTVFVKGESIPVSPKASKDAFKIAYDRLKKGKILGIFPESCISSDGQIGKFYRGYEMMPTDYKGVIIPVFIDGVFGSIFAKYKGTASRNLFKRREISVYYAEALPKNTPHNEVRETIIKMKEKYAGQ
jgi:acyl-[acyl-carrier-protein]-phospholipid O-acyltransferase/long-chain-fatty-acid--[acyl-carrier-protein] ligase